MSSCGRGLGKPLGVDRGSGFLFSGSLSLVLFSRVGFLGFFFLGGALCSIQRVVLGFCFLLSGFVFDLLGPGEHCFQMREFGLRA